jgi:hypothetical protein
MLDSLYEYFRGAAGFSLVVLGLGFLLPAQDDRARRSFGAFNAAAGFLLSLSAFEPALGLPSELGKPLRVAGFYAMSQSILEIALSVFGGERREGARRRAYLFGAAWSVALWRLPLLDYAFGLALYAWPLAVCCLSFFIGRLGLRDVPKGSRRARRLSLASGLMGLILAALLASRLASSVFLYRVGMSLLEISMLGWYFSVVRHPGAMSAFRAELEAERERNRP